VLLGNDTQSALDGACCAVAVAPLGYAHDLRAIATIGVGYDGSPESGAALAAAHRLAGERAATLRALRVVKMPTSALAGFTAAAWGQELEDILRDTRERIAGLDGVEVTAVLGLSGEELAAFGDKVDLLVVGSRGYGPLHRMVFGSTSAHLATQGRCPLLVWPRAALSPEPAAASGADPADAR
jgi:nucleotide-binding universal stress UspA family protein